MIVYVLIFPNDKKYIGITGSPLHKRVMAHQTRARSGKRHPLCNAMRKYGIDNFKAVLLVKDLTLEEAKSREIMLIEAFKTTNRAHGYNLSPGGDHDAGSGGKIFWDRINANPEERAEYLGRLSAAKKENDWSDYGAMAEAAKQWREDNPELAATMLQKALTAAQKWHQDQVSAGWKPKKAPPKNPGQSPSIYVKEVWASRSDLRKREIGAAISASLKKRYASRSQGEVDQANNQLSEARRNIDHDKRKAQQRKAIQEYWTPERRAEKSEQMRRQYLESQDLRHTECRT